MAYLFHLLLEHPVATHCILQLHLSPLLLSYSSSPLLLCCCQLRPYCLQICRPLVQRLLQL